MSMRIQDALSNCCEGVKNFATSAAAWIGKTVTATGSFLIEGAQKTAEFVKPHFEHLKTFAQQNKQSLIIAGVAFTLGAIVSALISSAFNRGTQHHPVTTAGTTAATTV